MGKTKSKRRYVGAYLRPELDDDIEKALDDLSNTEDAQAESELVRQGLRYVLGITSQKVIEIRQQPVPMPGRFMARSMHRRGYNTSDHFNRDE